MLRSALAVLLLAIPLYPKFPLVSVSNTYVAIRLDDILVVLSLVLLLINQFKNRFSLLKFPVTKVFIAYFIAITISFLNAYLIFQTEPTNILLLHLFRRFEYISLFFLTVATIKTKQDFRSFFLFAILASIGVIAYGYGQRYFQLPVVSTMNEEFSKGQLLQMNVWTRISSTFAGHYDLAAYASVFLVVLGSILALIKNKFIKIFLSVNWLLLFHILTLTASRVSIFAFIGGMVLSLILIKKYIYIIPVFLIFAFSLINSKDLNQRLLATIPALKNQFISSPTSAPPQPSAIPTIIPTSVPSTITQAPIAVVKTTPIPTPIRHASEFEQLPIDADAGVARSGEIRFNAEWPRAITAFNKNRLNGTGLGSITLATDNDYLRSLGESGLLGLTTFLAIFLYFFVKTIPYIFSKQKIPLIFFASMVTMLANATLIDVFEASKTAYLFWIMMGFYYQSFYLFPTTKK